VRNSGNRARKGAVGLAVLCLLAGFLTVPAATREEKRLAGDPIWDDGKAEVSIYQVEEPYSGQVRRFEARMIVVKEDFKREQLVKSEPGPVPGETFPVLKLNHLRLIPAGTYDYHQIVSVFLDRETFRTVKLTMAHFESCGITYVEAIPKGDRLIHTSHSYWDGEGDRVQKIPFTPADYLYDALPLQLRGLDFTDSSPRKARVLPTQMGGRVRSTSLVPMEIQVAGKESLKVPAGVFETYRVEITLPEGKENFFFETAFPHHLIQLDTMRGGHYRLRKTIRLDYWSHHDEGDEKILE